MKRVLLAVVVFILAGALYAQQASTGSIPNSSQTKQTAQQFSSQAKNNSSQFETGLADLTARNTSNKDLETFNRIKREIDDLESKINEEQIKIRSSLDRGQMTTQKVLDRLDRMIKQHKEKIAELDSFVSGS